MTKVECWLAMLLTSMLFAIGMAAPLPPNVPKAETSLAGVCTWGKVDHVGNAVTISGGSWTAEGEIVGDKLHVTWSYGDRQAAAEYRIEGRTLKGAWAWFGEEARLPETIEIRAVVGPER